MKVDVVGLALFVGWNAALLAGLLRTAWSASGARARLAAALAASLAAVLALALQTDVLGVPWLTYCVWWLGGTLAGRERAVNAKPS